MVDMQQDRRVNLEASITNGISKALTSFGVGSNVSVQTALVLDEGTGRYVPEVALKFKTNDKISVNGKSRNVGAVVELAMSAGDQDRLAAIRLLVPSFGTQEGETALTERVWTKQTSFTKDDETFVVYSNRNSSILNGLL